MNDNNNLITTEVDAPIAQVEQFVAKVDQESWRLFANDSHKEQLKQITSNLLADCRQLHQRGDQLVPAIVIVGRVGEGKSWLAQCFLTDHPDNEVIRGELKTGQNDTDRTTELIWFGTEQSFEIEAGERFIQASREQMLDLGRNYVVGDSPGISDADIQRTRIAGLAARSAPIKIVVFSRSQAREGSLRNFLHEIDGALILPVCKFRPKEAGDSEPDQTAVGDIAEMIEKWQAAAPHTQILPACFMPDEGIFGTQEAQALMRQRLKDSLAPQIDDVRALQRAVDREIAQKLHRAKMEIAELLADFRARVGSYLDGIKEMTGKLSDRLLNELLGEEIVLRAGIRRRFRADLIDRTPLIAFPYRSFLGVLAFTAGAWDSLIFSIVGSVPSLAKTLFQSAKNLKDAKQETHQRQHGVSERIEKLVQDELRAEVENFHLSLAAVLDITTDPEREPPNSSAHVHGLETIEAESHEILRRAVKKNRGNLVSVWLLALAGAGVFLYLVAGPIFSIYQTYISAHSRVMMQEEQTGLLDFLPDHAWTTMIGSVFVSAAPAFVIAFFAIAWCCARYRVSRTTRQVTATLDEKIKQQMANGSLRIELADPRLDAARYLVSIGPEE